MSGCSRCYFKEFSNTGHLDITETASHSQSTSSICKWTSKPYHSLFSTPTTDTIMFPSLLSIYCLHEVDISNCGLSQLFPEAIGCLHWLEMLNLGGNNFVTLPSLGELFKLVYLNLENCKKLEYLPELPFPTTIEQDLRKNKYWKRTGLFIFNCPKISIAVFHLSKLKYLNLGYNPNLIDSLPEFQSSSLTQLYLEYTGCPNFSLVHSPSSYTLNTQRLSKGAGVRRSRWDDVVVVVMAATSSAVADLR
ncbi:unnamed protein product [Vicia faba]|uniref:Uncharacterized protein n=1 Tax=Vicia faba TaxID=3906 RepID=A0AAV1AM93_VICFA|nr:unnamed protein product [Vicia faba]